MSYDFETQPRLVRNIKTCRNITRPVTAWIGAAKDRQAPKVPVRSVSITRDQSAPYTPSIALLQVIRTAFTRISTFPNSLIAASCNLCSEAGPGTSQAAILPPQSNKIRHTNETRYTGDIRLPFPAPYRLLANGMIILPPVTYPVNISPDAIIRTLGCPCWPSGEESNIYLLLANNIHICNSPSGSSRVIQACSARRRVRSRVRSTSCGWTPFRCGSDQCMGLSANRFL